MAVTGYTSKVIDGAITTLPEYAERCAAAFLFCMRDSDTDKLPDVVKPSDYYAKDLVDAEAERSRLAAMTTDQRDAAWRRFQADERAYLERRLAENAAEVERFKNMRENVTTWDAPDQFRELRRFMLQQLDVSRPMSEDDIRRYNPPSKLSRDEWHAKALAEAERKVESRRANAQKEVDKADRETRFIRDLRACFNR